jgi:general stress protein 26
MNISEAQTLSLELVNRSTIAYLSTIDSFGFPFTKAMLNLYHLNLEMICFSTNTSSKRVKQINENSKASVYYCDEKKYVGLLLIGTIKVDRDICMRKSLWFEGSELFYPLGIDDPDYSVLQFKTEKCDLYNGKEIIQFNI